MAGGQGAALGLPVPFMRHRGLQPPYSEAQGIRVREDRDGGTGGHSPRTHTLSEDWMLYSTSSLASTGCSSSWVLCLPRPRVSAPRSCRSPPRLPALPDPIPTRCRVSTGQKRIRQRPRPPSPLPPPGAHVDRSSHTSTSRVSSVIPMASKVTISSACGTGTAELLSPTPPAARPPERAGGSWGGHSPSGSS